jgi:Icc protein
MKTFRLGLVADIHAGRTRSNIRSAEALALLDGIVREANERAVDAFITLGDNVNATSASEDRHYLASVGACLAGLRMPVLPIFGNNEFKFLGRDQAAQALRCNAVSEMLALCGYTLIVWRADCTMSLDRGVTLTSEDLAWLERTLQAASYPAILFLHVPIDDHSLIGNHYFEHRPELARYSNAAHARSIVEASGKVVLVVAGHVHWSAGSTIDGIHYRTLPSLTDTFRLDAEPSAAWAILDLRDEHASLEVFGREPMTWSAPLKVEGTRWRRPLSSQEFDDRMRGLWHH